MPRTAPRAPLTPEAPRKGKGSPVPFILVLVVLAVAGYFGWKEFDRRQKLKQAHEAEYQRKLEEMRRREAEEAARLAAEEARRKAEEEARRNKGPVEQVVVKKPKVHEKSETEILLEDAAARKEMLAKIEEARKKPVEKALNGFGGIRFGEPLASSGAPVKWGTVLDDGTSVGKRGAAFAVKGPALKTPFMSLGSQPLAWVTPKTRKPYRIEFGRPLALAAGSKHDPETTNLVAFISKRYGCEPFVLGPNRPERKGCEYVFPIGNGTITIVERGADLTFTMEREDLKQEALAEAEALREEAKQVAEADGKALDSMRYTGKLTPDRKMYAGVKFKDETPRTFCGVFFACPPPENATVVVPQSGAKGFFMDYVRAKCPPFRGFTRGRADIDSFRGGIYAVRLFSPGGEGGLDDREYFESVKAALETHYKVKPTEKKGEQELPELTYTVGDLDIVFGPDPRGGFYLNAQNQVLAKMADAEPKARSTRKPGARR